MEVIQKSQTNEAIKTLNRMFKRLNNIDQSDSLFIEGYTNHSVGTAKQH